MVDLADVRRGGVFRIVWGLFAAPGSVGATDMREIGTLAEFSNLVYLARPLPPEVTTDTTMGGFASATQQLILRGAGNAR
jgi:hypothetical protein